MNPRTLAPLAQSLRSHIGAHHRLIGTGCTDAKYHAVQRKSDECVALAKYLIQTLADRHAATVFAHACGMPGYIFAR